MALPQEILDRVDRVMAYHQASKYPDGSPLPSPMGSQPNPFRSFDTLPRIALPTTLLDVPITTLTLLHDGLEAVPPSLQHPPQNLKTLASWLHMAAGASPRDNRTRWVRACPSGQDTNPCEIYVAAFGLADLESGFYHFNPKEFALRKMRGGPETLATLKRGRPDLAFLKTVPAALLVSTIFSRSTWRFQRRAYRHAVLDAGHMVQNLAVCATGLGIQTLIRLRITEANARYLIGLPADEDFGDSEAVHAMVVWGDKAEKPMTDEIPAPLLEPIARVPLANDVTPFGSILGVHDDCVAPGIAVREIRPPMTELSVVATEYPAENLEKLEPPAGGLLLRPTLLARTTCADFIPGAISRDSVWQMSRVAFRGGSYFPLFPEGPHMGLVRPFWIVRSVSGLEPGIWYYRPQADEWIILGRGDLSEAVEHQALDNGAFRNAAAVCVMVVNLHRLLALAGPEIYRLALLEAGIAGQRIYLGAAAQGLGVQTTGGFYDETVRAFLGLEKTGWEPLYMVAVGQPAPLPPQPKHVPNALKRTRAADFYRK